MKCYSPSTGALRHGSCKGDVWAKGHRLFEVGVDLIFCGKCGAYSVGRINHLYNLCPGAPWSGTARKAKDCMYEAKHLESGICLGLLIPLVRFFQHQPHSAPSDVDVDLEVDDIAITLHDLG